MAIQAQKFREYLRLPRTASTGSAPHSPEPEGGVDPNSADLLDDTGGEGIGLVGIGELIANWLTRLK